jgi:superfamily II DNA/RNA helicase
VPEQPEDYVHRIGRTGRAGKVGRAITLVTPVEELSMRAIERLTGQPVERVAMPGFGGTTSVRSSSSGVGAKPLAAARRAGSSSRRSFRPRRASR